MAADTASHFSIEEATIGELHRAYREGRATALGVTEAHLDRIAAYDRQGPTLGAIIITNPQARAEAAALDAHFQQTGTMKGPLHGIPVLVKDNYDVAGLQTTAGSSALLGWVPSRDATVVRALRDAGAVILAKTTMSEWARGGLDNINSVLPGFARNPYNTAYATGGSSGGTGAGLAASFGVVGLGSDTWGSIRNPSSNNALVGLRPSWALVSRAGMVGLYDARDTAGPMARTVADLAVLLDVIAGVDGDDPATAEAAGNIPPSYTAFLDKGGARGKRLGVLRQAFPSSASDPLVVALLERAIADLGNCGAEIIDPFVVPEFDAFPAEPHPASEVRAAIERYLAGTGPRFPKTLAELVASGKYHPLHETGLRTTAVAPSPNDDPAVAQLEASEMRMRAAYLAAMERDRIDALILPVAALPPKLNGDRTAAGATTWIASGLHWPAAVVPMGYTHEDLPSGLQIVGRPWSEPLLIGIAFAYEQATRHRKPPAAAPKLDGSTPAAHHIINDPAIVAQIERAFAGYNRALGANDVEALNGYFFDHPSTVRYGNGENLYGYAEIKAYRASVIPSGNAPQRERTVITTFGQDFATVATLSKVPRPGKIGRTMQTWVRFPQGWRIVAAHVSTIDDPGKD